MPLVMFSTMQLIINEIFELEKFDYEKLMKYIRCMFQVILGTDDNSALQLVDQALQIAGEANEVRFSTYGDVPGSCAALANLFTDWKYAPVGRNRMACRYDF